MWPRTDLTELLGIEHPIVQAPMAGSSTPALAAAVSNAGGLGSLGCATMPPDDFAKTVAELRAATNRPFNLNFFAHRPPSEDPEAVAQVRARLRPLYEARGLGEPPDGAGAPFEAFDEAQLAAVLEVRPAVVSFHFGLPAPAMIRALKDAGCRILCSATTVAEARALEAAGVDAVIAQGWEAGGHRGAFDVTAEDVGVGTMALVPQVCDAVGVPVIASGGIADGRGIAAAFALGAGGVQMGTAFLSCPEASVSEAHRAALRTASDDDTRLTRAFSGRPARARTTPYIEAMAGTAIPEFPGMFPFAFPLLRSSVERGDDEFQFLLYGQAAPLGRELPAADLVRTLIDEARQALRAP